MSDNIAIKVEHISKTFHEQMGARSVKQGFVSLGKKLTGKKEKTLIKGEFTALKDINFEVKKGEFFGIVGRNGSGKSTLLKMLAGVYTPTKGKISINGKLTPFIELGVGFNPELNGRDNIYLNAALLGFSRKQTDVMYDDIVEFAELKDFMDTKLKNYSSGMQVRLAFSVAIRAESDILLLDEVLAVGDADFQRKCYEYFALLKSQKRTVILVTHDMNAVRKYCDRAILVNAGSVEINNNADVVAEHYMRLFNMGDLIQKRGISEKRWGNAKAQYSDVTIETKNQEFIIRTQVNVNESIGNPVFGVSIKNSEGQKIIETNTIWKKIKTNSYKKGQVVSVYWKFPDIFTNGSYIITIAIADRDGVTFYDWWDGALSFTVNKDDITPALTMPYAKVNIM